MIDAVTLEIIHAALRATCAEMEAAIVRTAMSIIIREQYDLGVAVLDPQGRVMAGSALSGRVLAEYAATYPLAEGDVVIFNDPYLSHGEISHLGDTMVCVPIFWAGRLNGWGIAWGHQMDVGATAPAGMPTTATEIFHEGLQIPPIKLCEAGRLNEGVMALLTRNSRAPEMMRGDTLALMAAGKIAERRLSELFERYGEMALERAFATLADQARVTVRRLIALLPERELRFDDVMDGDGFSADPIQIRLAVRKTGDRVVLDFTGTAPQTRGPINYPLNPDLMRQRFYNSLRLHAGDSIGLDGSLDPNHGVYDSIDVIIPEGCLLNPRYPAPVGLRHLTVGRLHDMTYGIMSQAFPDRAPAATNGSLNCYSLLGASRGAGGRWLCFEVTAAGSGARPFADGIDAFSWNTRLKNAPVEFVETVYPVRIERYALRPDTGGPGRQRGGHGIVRRIRLLEDAELFFLDERQRHRPWGLYGGQPAVPGSAFIERAGGATLQLPSKFDSLALRAGDTFVLQTGGGGGWGDPFTRDPELVAEEVRGGLTTVAAAYADYGVCLTHSGAVDHAATSRRRLARPARQGWLDRGEPVDAPLPGQYRATARDGATAAG